MVKHPATGILVTESCVCSQGQGLFLKRLSDVFKDKLKDLSKKLGTCSLAGSGWGLAKILA